ncbi:hypothetical protein [Brachybacterium sp. Z12]|uniref:hypothetical protein n=1 Tax=Brachybacterium sp. Z12 TaxID=2759167 RepID=UPI00223BC31B|nr:hypothetical protein [Brachybacterium sp. Z12]
MIAADLFALVLACAIAVVIRQNLAGLDPAPDLPESVVRSAAVIVAAWMLAILVSGGVNPDWSPPAPRSTAMCSSAAWARWASSAPLSSSPTSPSRDPSSSPCSWWAPCCCC